VNTDAYRYVQESDELFNVVIVDLPDPNNESLSKLYSDTFYRLLQQRLTPDGAFVTQATSPYFARRSFWTIARTVEASGLHTLALHTYVPTFGEWGFVIGSPHLAPQLTVPDLELRYLNADVLTATMIFDPDIADSQEFDAVNTLDNPLLPRFYEQDWRHWN
jgi:spermidine synthase